MHQLIFTHGATRAGAPPRIAIAPGPIEVVKGLLGIIAQRVDLRDLVGASMAALAFMEVLAAVAILVLGRALATKTLLFRGA